jgi:hypothetical protein
MPTWVVSKTSALNCYNVLQTWTTALCRTDSDGDGKTNGHELGDPDCTWSEGAKPKTSIGLSHPGIIHKNVFFITYTSGADHYLRGERVFL